MVIKLLRTPVCWHLGGPQYSSGTDVADGPALQKQQKSSGEDSSSQDWGCWLSTPSLIYSSIPQKLQRQSQEWNNSWQSSMTSQQAVENHWCV